MLLIWYGTVRENWSVYRSQRRVRLRYLISDQFIILGWQYNLEAGASDALHGKAYHICKVEWPHLQNIKLFKDHCLDNVHLHHQIEIWIAVRFLRPSTQEETHDAMELRITGWKNDGKKHHGRRTSEIADFVTSLFSPADEPAAV